MKVLVGVLHCIEKEFDECLEKIVGQEGVNLDYFVIKNLPNKEAHDKLYKTFMENAHEVDVFIKIDADMVLTSPLFIKKACERLYNLKEVDSLKFHVFDLFSDRLIPSLHVYKSSVNWVSSQESIFVDTNHEEIKVVEFSNINDPLVPAADHCPNPSDFQAFHFGVHKAVKIIQKERDTVQLTFFSGHSRNLYLTSQANSRDHSRPRALALCGMDWAVKVNAGAQEVDFDSTITKDASQYYSSLSDKMLREEVDQIRKSHLLWLPFSIWRLFALIRYNRSKHKWRTVV